jgi:16S rRNA (guanine527-N7)-methyltransferase
MKHSPHQGFPGEQHFIRDLLALSQRYDIELGDRQAMLCTRHVQAMLQWNLRTNLTRITQPEEILSKHLLDALLPARWLPRQGPALDIGTGAGFPGLPLKILYPDLHMVLLEANHKKVSFLKILLSQLRLEGIAALQGRWETFTGVDHPLLRAPLALITMRALKLPGRSFGIFAAKVLQPGGIFAYWSGPPAAVAEPDAEPEIMGHEFTFEGAHGYELPRDSGRRRLLIWKRNAGPP